MDDEFDPTTLALLTLYDIRRDVAAIAEVLTGGGETEDEEDDEDNDG